MLSGKHKAQKKLRREIPPQTASNQMPMEKLLALRRCLEG
jgi:hypothetical protein